MQSNHVFFSIVIPTYNCENYINDTVQSILSQSFEDYEIIIIDDGSSDSTPFLVEELAKSNEKVKSFYQENRGAGSARNCGIENAIGEYVFFVDADDGLLENSLKKLNELVEEKKQPDIIVFTAKETNLLEEGEKVNEGVGINDKLDERAYKGKEAFELFLKSEIIPAPWNKIFKRELFLDASLRFHESVHHQDFGLIPRLLGSSDEIFICKEDLYHYRRRPNSVTYSCDEKHAYSIFVVLGEIWSFILEKGWEEFSELFQQLFWEQVRHNLAVRIELFSEENLKVFLEELKKQLNNFKWDINDIESELIKYRFRKSLDLTLNNVGRFTSISKERVLVSFGVTLAYLWEGSGLLIKENLALREENNKLKGLVSDPLIFLKQLYWRYKNKKND